MREILSLLLAMSSFVFGNGSDNLAKMTPKDQVSVILTGDVMLGRSVMAQAEKQSDPNYPFRKTADILKSADIVFINLENPIVKSCPRHESGFKFCTTSEIAEGLVFAGVDVVNLANNHSSNYGKDGVEQTKKFLEERGISVTSLDSLTVRQFSSLTVGFLGFNLVDKKLRDEDLRLVQESDKKVDVLIVGVHWGVEYRDKATKLQREIATELVEAGADVIVGHHPHWVQEVEYIDGKPVYFSLGNFIFDQMWSEKTKKGLVIRLTYEEKKLIREEKLPIYIKNVGQPSFVPGEGIEPS